MIVKELNFLEDSGRKVPVMLYLPDNFEKIDNISVCIFGNGFQGQSRLTDGLDYYCKNYTYLAKFFTQKNYAFISIQFEVLGDFDNLPDLTKGQKIDQIAERTHLWIKDEQIILFVIEKLKKEYKNLNFDKFIIAGHSNGADVAKFFANRHSEKISYVISLDGRRCPISPFVEIKLLSFEGNDTTTDDGVIPGRQGFDPLPGEREKLEYIIIKPKNALHRSYDDRIKDDDTKEKVCKTIEFVLNI